MKKNPLQFEKGFSLTDFMKHYGTEPQCAEALFQARWPSGFQCSGCGGHRYSVIKTRHLYQCSTCHHQTSLISGTLFEQTKLPLTVLVFGDPFADPNQNQFVGFSLEAANWRFLQHRLEPQAQDHAGDERAR